MEKCFIRTTDKDTADKLLKLGFQLVQNAEDVYVFINDSALKFEEDNHNKCQYTDKLFV